MKRIACEINEQFSWFYVTLTAGLLLVCSGCASDSLQRCYQAKSAYAATLETAVSLRNQGLITQTQVDSTKAFRVAAKVSLDGWESAAKSGDASAAQTYEQKFNAAAAVIQRLIDAARPATRPTGASHGSSGSIGGGAVHLGTGGDGITREPARYRSGMAVGERSYFAGRRAA